jgi:hypothetical protein
MKKEINSRVKAFLPPYWQWQSVMLAWFENGDVG